MRVDETFNTMNVQHDEIPGQGIQGHEPLQPFNRSLLTFQYPAAVVL